MDGWISGYSHFSTRTLMASKIKIKFPSLPLRILTYSYRWRMLENMADHPVQIIVSKPDHTFKMENEDKLRDLLIDEDIQARSLVVISVVGAFRKGKSFLLNFLLRYLNHVYNIDGQININQSDWIGDEDSKLEGFVWKGGLERITTGIHMWSRIFKVDLPTGERLAIILLDTQGMFDNKTTISECVTMFAMSTMLSSVQIYNLSSNIQENDLQHLQLFAEYGRLAMANSKHTPFQNLLFLVRDWYGDEHGFSYGFEGGQKFLNMTLSSMEQHDSKMQYLRTHIRACFAQLSCFLLPHPGLYVARNSQFQGKLRDIEMDFKTQLKEFVPMLLGPKNLVIKKIQGQPIAAVHFIELFKNYMEIFNSSKNLPEPKSVFDATAEASNKAAVRVAEKSYAKAMRKFVQNEMMSFKRLWAITTQVFTINTDKDLDNTAFLEHHRQEKEKAIEIFNLQPKMGGEEYAIEYRRYLEDEIEKHFRELNACNEGTNYFDRLKQMLVLLTILLTSIFTKDLPSFHDLKHVKQLKLN